MIWNAFHYTAHNVRKKIRIVTRAQQITLIIVEAWTWTHTQHSYLKKLFGI